MKSSLLTAAFAISTFFATAQNTIVLKNASFEDFPAAAHTPTGWHDCGFPGETPPDVQPNPAFQVSTKPQQGNTYLGLVTRDNETYEAVSQKLMRPLEGEHCYDFSLWLARSNNYWSVSKTSGSMENFSKACVVRVWGGNSDCDRREKLFESGPIDHTSWKIYPMKLKPKTTYAYITIDVFYYRTMVPYNGNVLIDNASVLEEDVSCNKTPQPIAQKDPVKTPTKAKDAPRDAIKGSLTVKTPKDTPPTQTNPTKSPSNVVTQIAKAQSIDNLNIASIRVNDRFNMDNVLFETNSFQLNESSNAQLDKLVTFLTNNSNVVVEIGGHTNSNPDFDYAYELSTNRANAVATYLRDKGVPDTQLRTKGYGKTYPVTGNDSERGRRLNQRVEVKILKK
jgi:outer membrane protein OmpA-like peptidoglycan-associated protein